MQPMPRSIACLMALVAALSGPVAAAAGGVHLVGMVFDPDGRVIPGVTVVATSRQVLGFRQVGETDVAGVFSLDFTNLAISYQLRLEKEGYQALESEQRWHGEGTERLQFTMRPGPSALGVTRRVSSSSEAVDAFNVGAIAFNAGDYDKAAKKLLQAVGYDPELHQAWGVLARARLEQGMAAEAAEAAEKAVALGSTAPAVWQARHEAYAALGDQDRAAAALSEMQELVRRLDEATTTCNEAVALAKSGDHAAAFARFEQALAVDPSSEAALLGAATTGLASGHPAEAARAAETLLGMYPRHEQALRIRYNAALELGDGDRIAAALVGLAAVEPAVARNGLLKLAYEAYDARDTARARARFAEVLEVDPDQPQSHYALAVIALEGGATDEARRHLQRFLELAPADPSAAAARDLLARVDAP